MDDYDRIFFVTSYRELGLGIEACNPRQEFRVFLGYSENQIRHYLERERQFFTNENVQDLPEGEIFPRQTVLRSKTTGERCKLRGEIQIERVDAKLARDEIQRMGMKQINVSKRLDEFIEPEIFNQ